MKKLLLIFPIIIAVILAMLWRSPPEFFFSNKKTRIEALPLADSYMRNTITTKYSIEGYAAYKLKAKMGFYYHKEDRFELESPQLISRNGDNSTTPWQLKAEKARTAPNGERIILSGDVHAWQDIAQGKNEFFSSEIIFTPQDNSAQSKRKVIFKYPSGKTTGVGMKANFNTETYHLLSKVQGTHYAP